jgi:hypothetical protein
MDKYKRIARGNGFFGRYRIYLGNDHLLLLEQFFFIQFYYRFYFRDIQGIIACRTIHFVVALVLLVFGIGMVYVGALPVTQGKELNGGSWFLIVTSAILSLFSLIQVIRGNTYRIAMITKVQKKRLKGTMSRRKWRVIRAIIVPLIETGQERLGQDEKQSLEKYEQPDSPATMQTPPGA